MTEPTERTKRFKKAVKEKNTWRFFPIKSKPKDIVDFDKYMKHEKRWKRGAIL